MGKGKGKVGPPWPWSHLLSDIGLKPVGWKVKCRRDKAFCLKLLLTAHPKYRWNFNVLKRDIKETFGGAGKISRPLSRKEMAEIRKICNFPEEATPHDDDPRYRCAVTREMYGRFWEHRGPFSALPRPFPKGVRRAAKGEKRVVKGERRTANGEQRAAKGERRAANLAPGESSNAGVWVAVGLLLCLILAAIGSYFCLCREGKKKSGKNGGAGALSQRGSKAGKSSKRIGKSRISSRKSAKKLSKLGSLRSKSAKGSGGPSKGAKTRPSKSSAKSLKKK